jgi:hypothetical protein
VTRVARLAGVLGIVLPSLVLVSGAVAQEKAPLSASPAAVTLDAEGDGEVKLSNDVGVDMELSLTIVGEDGQPVSEASVTPPSGGRLAAGSTGTATVRVPSRPATSNLVIVASPTGGLPQGAVLRVPLSRTSPAKPAVGEWTMVYTHAGEDAGTELPLTSACAGLALNKPTELGTLQADGERLTITGACDDDTSKSLTLSIPALDSNGRSYKGKVKVGGTDVDLTVEDTLSWMLVAFLISIGIAVALGINAYRGWGRAAKDVLRSSYLAEQLVASRNEKSADRSFAKAAGELGLPANVREWTIADAVRQKLAELRRPLRRFPNTEEIEAAREAIQALELEVRQWPDTANRLAELDQRSNKLDKLTTYLSSILPRTLKRQGPLDLAAMRDVRAAADEAVALANDWPAESIATAGRMAEKLPPGEPARVHFHSVLEQFRVAPGPTAAKEALDDFWTVEAELREAAAPSALLATAMPEAGALAWTGLFEGVSTDDPAATARGLAAQMSFIDTWVLVVLLLAALVAGMQALWVDKTFGGAWDIASALVWGLGAGAISEPLSAALGDFGRSWLTAREGS